MSPFFYEITGTISFSKNRTHKTLLFNIAVGRETILIVLILMNLFIFLPPVLI